MLKNQQLFIQNKFKITTNYVTKIEMENLCVKDENEVYLGIDYTKLINYELIKNLSDNVEYIKICFEGEMNKHSITIKCLHSDIDNLKNINFKFNYSEKPQIIKLTKNQCSKLRDKLFIYLKK